jgi:hypothetical protein
MNLVFCIINKIVSILLFIFGLYFFGITFSFIFLGTVFYGSSINVLFYLLFGLSLISIWLFSYSFINKSIKYTDKKLTNKEPYKEPYKGQYKDWF